MTRFSNTICGFLFAGTLVASTAGIASAADLALPPPPVIPPVAPSFNGWYLRGDVGVGIQQLNNLRSTFDSGFDAGDAAFNTGAIGDTTFVDLGAGYQFNNWFRADVTGEYRTASHYSSIESYSTFCTGLGGATRCYDNYAGNVSSAVFLANGYLDLGTWWGITPFVGAGVGVADNFVNGLTDVGVTPGAQGFGYAPSSSYLNFAWAGMAGLDYAITPNLKLEIGYRYLNLGNVVGGPISCTNTAVCGHEVQRFNLASNDIRIGMRWMFNDIPAPAPMMPLISKY